MKVLVATNETQGHDPNDFMWVPDGELVGRYGVLCDLEKPDGSGCGCGRGFGGLVTYKATTSAMVVERDLSEADWRASVNATLYGTGWAQMMDAGELADTIDAMTEDDLYPLVDLPVGTVVGRRAWNNPDGSTTDLLVTRRQA